MYSNNNAVTMTNNNYFNDHITYLKKYYEYQIEICFKSELFGEKTYEHGSKIITLFSEIYPYLVSFYGLESSRNLLIKMENSQVFKEWFWRVKHRLGEEILCDPDFLHIGKWIGNGFFLKIGLNILYHNNLLFEQSIVKKIIERQIKILEDLKKENFFLHNGKKAIEEIDNGYILLKEKTITNINCESFYKENIIL